LRRRLTLVILKPMKLPGGALFRGLRTSFRSFGCLFFAEVLTVGRTSRTGTESSPNDN